MAIENVSAAPAGAAQVTIPRQLLERIGECLIATNDRLVVIGDLISIGLMANGSEELPSLLTAMRASLGNDPDGLTRLMPEIDGLLEARA